MVAGFFLTSPAIHADMSAISIRVDPSSKSEPGKPDRYVITQTHSLKVYVTNASKDAAEVKVKSILFGRDLKDHNIDKINEAEKEAQVKPLATETVEIPAATSTYTEEHYEMAAGAAGKAPGKNAKPGKKVEASGSRFVGYAVQVYQGEKLVAETYEPASMKDEVSKAAAAPKGGDIKAQAPKAAKK